MTDFDTTAALALLHKAGKLAAQAGKKVEEANKARGNALDLSIAGLAADGVLLTAFSFDVCDAGGNVVEHCTATLPDYAKGFKNADGSDNRKKQSAFRAAMLPLFFGVTGDQSAGAKAVWALFTGKALPTALALHREGISATVTDKGELVLTGGEGDTAKALRDAAAKSTSAMVKVAKGETGSNREEHGNDKGGETGRAATPGEIALAAHAIAARVAKGEEAICNSALSYLRAIAKLVADNPEAFADD